MAVRMAVRRYVVQLKAAKPFTVEAESVFVANPGFVFLMKGGVAIGAFPRETVEYIVEESIAATVTQARMGQG